MEAPEELHVLARNRPREIAVRGLKARGPRMDAVFYLLDAMRLFRGKSLREIRKITSKIGMLGKCGLDINNPMRAPSSGALPPFDFLEKLLSIIHSFFLISSLLIASTSAPWE